MLIRCKKCGTKFWQKPSKHFIGQGCPHCAKKSKGGFKEKYTLETFLEKAKEVHKDENGNPLYCYDKVEFKGMGEKVCIICPKHGEFWQRPHYHIHGNGCPE